MEKKEDRRVTMTKRMLKEALTEMLREVDIYHVSIRELCQRADINRTTFYKYYGSQFDLLADMENDLVEFLSNTIREYASNPKIIIRTRQTESVLHLEGGEDLGGVRTEGGHGGRDAHGAEKRAGRNPVRHPEGSVDHLRRESG